jgi:hypothetical protein
MSWLFLKNLFKSENLLWISFAFGLLVFGFNRTTGWDGLAQCAITGALAILYYLFTESKNIIAGERKSCTWIFIENRMTEPVTFLWGNLGYDTAGVDATTNTLLPNRVVARKIKHENTKCFSGKYPVVIIKQSENSKHVTLILQEPTELCHTKVFEITADGIKETSSPKHRNWHVDLMETHQE